MKNAGIFSAAFVVLKVLSYMIGARLKCSLCMAAPLGNIGYAKHRSAQTLCGSHRMAVSTSILFMGNFRCPYCAEMTGMRVWDRSNHRNFFCKITVHWDCQFYLGAQSVFFVTDYYSFFFFSPRRFNPK